MKTGEDKQTSGDAQGKIQTFRALRHRDFKLLFFGNTFASLGRWILFLAQVALANELTNSPTWVGIVIFSATGPFLVFALIAGVVADRVDRRIILTVTRSISMLLAVVMAVLVFAGIIELWHLIFIALLDGVARAFDMPSMQALLPNLIDEDELLNAISLNTMSMRGSQLFGPLAAVPLLAFLGVGPCFALASGLYVMSALSVWNIRPRPVVIPEKPRAVFGDLFDGFRYMFKNVTVFAIIAFVGGHCLLTMSFTSLLPTFANDVLDMGSTGIALLMSAMGAGGVLATFLLASFANFKHKSWLMLGTNLFSGITPVLFAISTLPYASLLLMAAVGGATVSFMTLNTTHIQTIVTDTMRGRVMSAYLMSAAGLMSISNVLMGGVAESIGAPATMALFGGLWIVLGTIAVLWRQDVWQIDDDTKAFPQEKLGEAVS